MKDLVVFRKWKNDGEILALFPEIIHDNTMRRLCTCYAHIGQHSSADYRYCLTQSRPATPDEYADLQLELERIGYDLKVRKKWIRNRT